MIGRAAIPPDRLPSSWICCQLGAREHYAIPRSLKRIGLPVRMITDMWCRHRSLPKSGVLSGLQGRFHPDLSTGEVINFTTRSIINRIGNKILRRPWYSEQQEINRAFQRNCISVLKRIPRDSAHRILFVYSYAAKDILSYARERGWTTILGQIDPGPSESRIVTAEYQRLGLPLSRFYTPPDGYWDCWRTEADFADFIVVNSEWSAACLVTENIPKHKIRIIPCAYESNPDTAVFKRVYPEEFSQERPMNVLFLGQPVIRKGIHFVLEAAEQLLSKPVQFTIVGGETDLPDRSSPANVSWIGHVPRDLASRYYRTADVFLLPTLSDGFALTQLEASSWRLPVLVSRHCGNVITDGKNGILLQDVSTASIVKALTTMLASPAMLQRMSDAATGTEEFGLEAIGKKLVGITQSPTETLFE